MNVVVLQGTVGREPQERELSSGGVVEYEVRVRVEDRQLESVPVVWYDAPASAAAFAVGTEVVVIGRVRRRFFRSGGATQARTEVVAEAVLTSRSRRRVDAAVESVLHEIQDLVSA